MTSQPSYRAGLDIGTTKICCVIAQQSDAGIEIIGMGMYGGRLIAGLVMTGGTTQLPDLAIFLEQLTNVPVRIGAPHGYQWLSDMVANPACSTGVWLVVSGGSALSTRQPGPSVQMPQL